LLRGTDQEGEAASGDEERGGDFERGFEVLDSAQGHEVEASLGARKIFGAAVEYIDVCQCKRSDYLAEERSLLVVGFNKGEIDPRIPELEGDAGKSGTGTQVGYEVRVKIFRHRGHGGHRVNTGEENACGE
jgi:hypothetical protein